MSCNYTIWYHSMDITVVIYYAIASNRRRLFSCLMWAATLSGMTNTFYSDIASLSFAI